MLLICYGTRPEYLKIKPLVAELKNRNLEFKILFTGQHQNIAPLDSDYAITIVDGQNRLDSIVASIMNTLSLIIQMESFHSKVITHVLVQGDTTTAMALALSSFHHNLKVIHLEAGLRTHDISSPFPEELNRQIIARIADHHLCPTILNLGNLEREGIKKMKYVVGNTGLDNLIEYKDKTSFGNKVLVTLHRRENHEIIDQYFEQIVFLSEKHPNLEFILPIHPNPNVQKHKHILDGTLVKLVDPLPHNELLTILVSCNFVITDSGGLQEECNFLDKICILCRESTERPEAVNMTTIICKNPSFLEGIVDTVIDDPVPCCNKYPFGNGTSSKRIVDIFETVIYKTNG